jgi:hypothetical protein
MEISSTSQATTCSSFPKPAIPADNTLDAENRMAAALALFTALALEEDNMTSTTKEGTSISQESFNFDYDVWQNPLDESCDADDEASYPVVEVLNIDLMLSSPKNSLHVPQFQLYFEEEDSLHDLNSFSQDSIQLTRRRLQNGAENTGSQAMSSMMI